MSFLPLCFMKLVGLASSHLSVIFNAMCPTTGYSSKITYIIAMGVAGAPMHNDFYHSDLVMASASVKP